MTGISFKSESSDDYLEISNGESLGEFIDRIKEKHGDEWEYMHVVCIESTDYTKKVVMQKIKNSKPN